MRTISIVLCLLLVAVCAFILGVLACVFFCRPDFVNGIIEIDFFSFVFEYLV